MRTRRIELTVFLILVISGSAFAGYRHTRSQRAGKLRAFGQSIECSLSLVRDPQDADGLPDEEQVLLLGKLRSSFERTGQISVSPSKGYHGQLKHFYEGHLSVEGDSVRVSLTYPGNRTPVVSYFPRESLSGMSSVNPIMVQMDIPDDETYPMKLVAVSFKCQPPSKVEKNVLPKWLQTTRFDCEGENKTRLTASIVDYKDTEPIAYVSFQTPQGKFTSRQAKYSRTLVQGYNPYYQREFEVGGAKLLIETIPGEDVGSAYFLSPSADSYQFLRCNIRTRR